MNRVKWAIRYYPSYAAVLETNIKDIVPEVITLNSGDDPYLIDQ